MISETLVTVEGPWEDGARQIDDSHYLFAVDVRELEELTLRLTLVEAKAQAPLTAENDSVYGVLSNGARPIQQDSTCRIFEIIFERKHIIAAELEEAGAQPVDFAFEEHGLQTWIA